MLIWYIVGFLVLVLVVFVGLDFTKFVNARTTAAGLKKGEKGVKVDAGGVLFVQGNRTYYTMPNGSRRKIADYPMDLTPGSRDMNMFTATLDQARKEHHTEQRNVRKEAKLTMESVAKDIVSRETTAEEADARR